MPRAREYVTTNRLPNGDIRRLRDGATNEVVASSRDHAHLRVRNTREHPATSTRGPVSINYVGRRREGSPSPNTGFEVFVPGRQGFCASRKPIPLAGAPTSIGTSLRGLCRSFPWCRRQRRTMFITLRVMNLHHAERDEYTIVAPLLRNLQGSSGVKNATLFEGSHS